MEEKSVKEMLELIEGIKQLLLVGKAVMKDGRIDLADLAALSILLTKQNELMAAFADLGDIKEEIKDISLDEAKEVVLALVAAAKEVKAA